MKFKHLSGEEFVFKSATGNHGVKSEYRVGQRVAVVYDIDDAAPPMIDSFSGL